MLWMPTSINTQQQEQCSGSSWQTTSIFFDHCQLLTFSMAYELSRSRKQFIRWKTDVAPPTELIVDLNSDFLANTQFSLEKGWEELWDDDHGQPYYWYCDFRGSDSSEFTINICSITRRKTGTSVTSWEPPIAAGEAWLYRWRQVQLKWCGRTVENEICLLLDSIVSS